MECFCKMIPFHLVGPGRRFRSYYGAASEAVAKLDLKIKGGVIFGLNKNKTLISKVENFICNSEGVTNADIRKEFPKASKWIIGVYLHRLKGRKIIRRGEGGRYKRYD